MKYADFLEEEVQFQSKKQLFEWVEKHPSQWSVRIKKEAGKLSAYDPKGFRLIIPNSEKIAPMITGGTPTGSAIFLILSALLIAMVVFAGIWFFNL